MATDNKPKIFLGSARESLGDLLALQTALKHSAHLLGWFANDARPKDFSIFLDTLVDFGKRVDAAVFIADATDILKKRSRVYDVCRDNVLFEIALFVGILGKDRVFVVSPEDAKLGWPSDIATLQPKQFSRPDPLDTDFIAMLETAMQPIAKEIATQLMRLGKRSSAMSEAPCDAHWILNKQQSEFAAVSKSTQIKADASDLFFLFCSPNDCDTAYGEIVSFCASKKSTFACELEAGYDLSGNWDLLTRLRVRKRPPVFFKELKEHLIVKGCITSQASSPFSRWRLFDVQERGPTFSSLVGSRSASKAPQVRQLFLSETKEYQRHRASRSFIFVDTQAPDGANHVGSVSDKTILLQSLARTVSGTIGLDIVEAVSIGGDGILIETFSTCAQSSAINDLNQSIGKLLASKKLQKYTLSCYFYREDALRKRETRK